MRTLWLNNRPFLMNSIIPTIYYAMFRSKAFFPKQISSFRFLYHFVLCGLLAVFISACSTKPLKKWATEEEAEAGIYKEAQENIRRKEYQDAIDGLNLMEKRFPFGEYSKAAQLSLIYALYNFEEPEQANAAADRFIRLHPQNPHVDYAYYMKGLISFPKIQTFTQRFAKVDMSKRDISAANVSFNHFSELTKRFPKSEYTPDALKRMEFLRNLLARHEIHVANYYLDRKAFLAAVNRGQYVLQNFEQTPAVPDAIAVMVQGYHEMNMHDLAQSSLQALIKNYPDHPALNSNGEFNFNYSTRESKTWLGIVSFGLLQDSTPPGFNTEKLYNSKNK